MKWTVEKNVTLWVVIGLVIYLAVVVIALSVDEYESRMQKSMLERADDAAWGYFYGRDPPLADIDQVCAYQLPDGADRAQLVDEIIGQYHADGYTGDLDRREVSQVLSVWCSRRTDPMRSSVPSQSPA